MLWLVLNSPFLQPQWHAARRTVVILDVVHRSWAFYCIDDFAAIYTTSTFTQAVSFRVRSISALSSSHALIIALLEMVSALLALAVKRYEMELGAQKAHKGLKGP